MKRRSSSCREEYRKEAAERSLSSARIMVLAGIPLVLFFAFQDIVALGTRDFLALRLSCLLALSCLAVVVFSPLRRHHLLIRTSHALTLTAVMVMISAIFFIIFDRGIYGEKIRMGVVGGLIAAIVVIFIFSGGVRMALPLIIGVPFVVLVLAVVFLTDLPTVDIAYLSNPGVAVAAVFAVAFTQEKLQYKEFLMRTLAQRRRSELEIEVNQVLDMNRELEKEIAQRIELEKQLEEQAVRDHLTGVLNRRAGLELLATLLRRAERSDESLTVCFIDIDNLKSINDQRGHVEGDRLIRHVAERIQAVVRKSDVVARLGGDEFIILFPQCDEARAHEIVGRLVTFIENEDVPFGQFSFSYGLSELEPGKEETAEDLIRKADNAMYLHKQQKKRRHS